MKEKKEDTTIQQNKGEAMISFEKVAHIDFHSRVSLYL